MKVLFIILLSITNINICIGQNSASPKYQISYRNSVNVAINSMGLADIPFQIDYNVIGNKDSSVILSFIEPVNPADNIELVINMPAKVIFNGKNWFTTDKGITTITPFTVDNIEKTSEEKIILDYKVVKYIGKTIENGYEAIIWVCKELPETLMPGGGIPPMGGAVLELSFPKYQSLWVATSVKKVFDVGSHTK